MWHNNLWPLDPIGSGGRFALGLHELYTQNAETIRDVADHSTNVLRPAKRAGIEVVRDPAATYSTGAGFITPGDLEEGVGVHHLGASKPLSRPPIPGPDRTVQPPRLDPSH